MIIAIIIIISIEGSLNIIMIIFIIFRIVIIIAINIMIIVNISIIYTDIRNVMFNMIIIVGI